ncbi:MAG: hypothetical protein IIC50_07410 [Planctomycetes bacterium]|nr:hypothetical protein [Planctomycetota bacterium]
MFTQRIVPGTLRIFLAQTAQAHVDLGHLRLQSGTFDGQLLCADGSFPALALPLCRCGVPNAARTNYRRHQHQPTPFRVTAVAVTVLGLMHLRIHDVARSNLVDTFIGWKGVGLEWH